MGATGWSFLVPYQEDMEQVLEDLKQAEFERGAYERPRVEWDAWEMFGLEYARDEDEREKLIEQFGLNSLRRPLAEVGIKGFPDWLKALNEAPEVRTREDLEVLQQFSSSGTGSILDISRAGELSPLPPEYLRQQFGTERPTQVQAHQWQMRIPPISENLYRCGEGIDFVIYKDGQPDEICIEGRSGD